MENDGVIRDPRVALTKAECELSHVDNFGRTVDDVHPET